MSVVTVIDSHAHLDAPEFEPDIDQVIARALTAGVSHIITIGAGYGTESAKRAVALADKHESVFAAIGVHPHDAKALPDLSELAQLIAHPKVVAIGETGLDFFRDWSPFDLQEKWFRAQISFALKYSKPLIIHSREAGPKCLEILTELGASKVGGVFHCFAEDAEFAKRLSQINFLVSFPGTITFKKADKLREVMAQIPLTQIMVETDAPFMAPEPNRSKRCESAFVVDTARKIAEIKGVPFEQVAQVTSETARKFFGL